MMSQLRPATVVLNLFEKRVRTRTQAQPVVGWVTEYPRKF